MEKDDAYWDTRPPDVFKDAFKNYMSSEERMAVLNDNIRKSKLWFDIDFMEFSQSHLETAEYLLRRPEDATELFNFVISEMDLGEYEGKVHVRVYNLPESCGIPIWEIRTQIKQLIKIEGYVSRPVDILLRPIKRTWECPSCMPKGTLILTPKGYKPIEEVNEVISLDEHFKPVTVKSKLVYTGRKIIWKINNSISCSAEHKWFVYRDGTTKVIQTKDLNRGDVLYRLNGNMYSMQKGICSTHLSPKRRNNKHLKRENLFREMQVEVPQFIPDRQRKSKIRQPRDNKIIYTTPIVHGTDSQQIRYLPQIDKEEISQVWDTTKDCKHTMQDKPTQFNCLQAWKEMWGKRLSKVSKEVSPLEMYQMWKLKREFSKKGLSSSSYKPKSSRPQIREFNDSLSITPYKVASINKTTEDTEMYDLIVPRYNNFIISNGVISHNCGNLINVIATDKMYPMKEPTKCGCGRKGKFHMVDEVLIPSRKIYVEEDVMEIGERQTPRSKLVILENDLTRPNIDRQVIAGKRVVVNGWLETFTSSASGTMDTYMIANSIEFVERGWSKIKTTPFEQEEFLRMAEKPTLIQDLSQAIMPTIYGEKEVKHALLLQLAGSDNVYDDTKFLEDRGNVHIGLIGGPGSGKTAMGKRIGKFWPIYKFAPGQTSTGRGLIATAVQDKLLEKWVLIPGVIPIAHLGLAVIDEMDKMNKEEYGYFNNAMNDLMVVISKAASGKLDTDTSILATMNPRGRVFVGGVPIYEQIDLPPDLLDRFDLVFTVTASSLEEDQRKVLRIGIGKRKRKDSVKPNIPEEKVIKYFAFARTMHPVIPSKLEQVIEDRIIRFTRPSSSTEQRISNRILFVILRLLHASARLHLRDEITTQDINEIMDLIIYSYKQQGLLDSYDQFDYAKTEHIDENIANAVPLVKETIKRLEQKSKPVWIDDLIKEIIDKVPEDKIEEAIEKLKRVGDLMEPRHGFLQLL